MKQNNYFKNHPQYKIVEDLNSMIQKYKSDLIEQGIIFDKKMKILEIGIGNGKFTAFCNYLGIKNYYGIDIDDYFFGGLKEKFNTYYFEKIGYEEFLLEKKEVYDIIFTSHIFEHLNQEEALNLSFLIIKSLKKGGKWINYMPNADSVLGGTSMMYGDITHKRLYNSISFEQILNTSNVKYGEIVHLNDKPTRFIFRVIHNIFKLFAKIYYKGMLQSFPKNYTNNLISVVIK